jgi:hypothetical protein
MACSRLAAAGLLLDQRLTIWAHKQEAAHTLAVQPASRRLQVQNTRRIHAMLDLHKIQAA